MDAFERLYLLLAERFPGQVERDRPLAGLTTLGCGGPAALCFEAKRRAEFLEALDLAEVASVPRALVAGGSNLLISDKGFEGLVLLVRSTVIEERPEGVVADAGVCLADLVSWSIDRGHAGLVFASGIPGSIGGAVRGNAGAYGAELAEVVRRVELRDSVGTRWVEAADLGFAYRDSRFKHTEEVIVRVELALPRREAPEVLAEASHRILAQRGTRLPGTPSAGCFFKNLPLARGLPPALAREDLPPAFFEQGKLPAGWLIERCGLKGYRFGTAQVSPQHANILTGEPPLRSEDLVQLCRLIVDRVEERFGVVLEQEVAVLG